MHFREGWSAADANDQETALHHLSLAVESDPNFGLARAMYLWQGGGNPAMQTSDFARAIADASKGGAAELILAVAMREATMNHAAAAATLFNAASELAPSDPTIAGFALTPATRPDARTAYERAKAFAARFPDYAPGYNVLAYTAWAAGDHDAALAAALKQVQLLPKNPNSHDSYAEILQWSGKLPDALMHYQAAVTMSPSFTEGYVGMAEVEALQGHYDKARADVQQALTRTTVPAQKLLYMRDLAGIDVLAGDVNGARAHLLAAASEAKSQGNNAQLATAYSQIATRYALSGDAKSAHSYLAMAQAANPEPAARLDYYAAMTHATLKHWEPANAAIAAGKAAPDLATLGGRLTAAEASLLTAQGKFADAIPLLEAGDQSDLLVKGRLAEAYAAAGRTADANRLQHEIMSDYVLALNDFPAVNARNRSRMAKAAPTKKK